MIETAQEAIKSILETYLPAELASRASPEGGTAVDLTQPARYLLNYDPKIMPIINQSLFPVCAITPARTKLDDRLSSGYVVKDWHSIGIFFLFLALSAGQTDTLNAMEIIQRQRSRYAEASIAALKKHQQSTGLEQIVVDSVEYTRTLPTDAAMSSFCGGVLVSVRARDQTTL